MARLPAPPPITGESEESVRQLANYVNRLYSALESQFEVQALGLQDGMPIFTANLPASPAAPATPTNLRAFGLYQQIFLCWDLDPNPAIGFYEISRAATLNGTYTNLTTSTVNSYMDRDLADNATWFYKVKAILLDGSTGSSLTSGVSATTLGSTTTVLAELTKAATALQSSLIQKSVITKAGVYTNADYTLGSGNEEVVGTITLDTPVGCNVLLLAKGWDNGVISGQALRIRVGSTTGGTLIDVNDGNYIKCFGVDTAPGSPTQDYSVTAHGSATDHMKDIALIGLVLFK